VWGNLDWGNANFKVCLVALHMISVKCSIVKKDIYVFNYVIIVESVH
jgi:hypothetical protein